MPYFGAAFAETDPRSALGISLSLDGIWGFWDSLLRKSEANFHCHSREAPLNGAA